MRILLSNRSGRRLDVRRVRRRLGRALRLLRLPASTQASVVLDRDSVLRMLHRRYFGLDTPTNVVSLGQWEGSPAAVLRRLRRCGDRTPLSLGDVVVSLDRAAAEARDAGVPLEDRTLMLIVHGVLHLLGHEHDRGGSAARRMERAEEELAASLHPLRRPRASKGIASGRGRPAGSKSLASEGMGPCNVAAPRMARHATWPATTGGPHSR
ncbi:MAG: rRNA maturation RNase YbeY [Nitrospirae bacterium]|nr:rRNA maturation RNase YbeY [Nitrospirota bacterium]